jgi:hypothetical protein
MLERLKRVVVESFVGAIALGYVLAQAILSFVNSFVWPIERWVNSQLMPHITAPTISPLQDALSQFGEFVFLIVVWYILLRWLYFTPVKSKDPQPAPNLERAT